MNTLSHRTINFIGLTICFILTSISFYLEFHVKLEPCPLCIIQRLLFIAIGFLFFFALFLNSQKKHWVYYFFIFFIAAMGAVIAGRHVFITTLPPEQVPSCGASLHYMLEVLPFSQAIQMIFQGTGNCAKVTWRLLSLSIPEWSLIFFILLAGIGLWQGVRARSES
jgi:protein dithiol:quinone oxidoreductase